MNTTDIQKESENTFTELLQLISSFEDGKFNTIPFEESWTAGQLARHLVMSNSGFIKLINGPVKETERNAAALAQKIKSDFLNFTTKVKSPSFVVPPEITYDKEELLNSLKKIKTRIDTAIETLDLSETCTAFELPSYGHLTRFEALTFMIYHTQRHIHQLKNIRHELAA